MVRRAPPADCPSELGPLREDMPAGTVLWRIHSERFPPTGFNRSRASDKRSPGRFDSLEGDYGYLYASETRLAVFAEVFLRADTVRASTIRVVPRVRLAGLRLSRLETVTDLPLVSLIGGEALGRVGQDAWLTSSDENDYPLTEAYAQAVRRWAPWAAGLVWLAKRDNRHRAYVLFDDRVAAADLRADRSLELDGAAEPLAMKMLARLNVSVEDAVT